MHKRKKGRSKALCALLLSSRGAAARIVIVRVLRAAVEHDNQRTLPPIGMAWDVDVVVPRTSLAGKGSRQISVAIRTGALRDFTNGAGSRRKAGRSARRNAFAILRTVPDPPSALSQFTLPEPPTPDKALGAARAL